MKTLTHPLGEGFEPGSFPAGDTDRQALGEALAAISDSDLETTIVGMKRSMDATHAVWLLHIGEYDRRQAAEQRHGLATTGWLRTALRLTGRVASRLVRNARGLARMPEVADRALNGEVTDNAIGQLDQARRRHPDHFPHHEHVFADVSSYLDGSELRQAIGHWEQQIDYPTAVATTRNRRMRRKMSINQTYDGTWAINGELDPESGAIVNKAIQTAARSAYLDADDRRQPWQIRADALTDICEQSLRKGTASSKGVKPHITVTVDANTLLKLKDGFGDVEGAPVPPETLDRLTCDATIIRILTDDAGHPIDVGRATRTIPPALRRALDNRDRGCQWEGCDAPADWCDAHHITPWAHGGPTNLDNLTLLCRTHHTRTHERSATHRISGGDSISDP